MMRIERLINLIAALLDTSRPLTAEQIRTNIAGYDQPNDDAFRRTFERDKEAIRGMGIPLETKKMSAFGDDPDGYIIPKDKYYLPHLGLEPDEEAALRVVADALLGVGDQAGAGLMKLDVDADAATWSGPRVITGASIAAEEPRLSPTFEALMANRPIRFSYRKSSGEVGERNVRPYALVHRRGQWYLLGHDEGRADVRAFRMSRVASDIEILDGTYEIPDDFAAEKHLLEAWELGEGEPVVATVRFAPELRWWAEQNILGGRSVGDIVSKESSDGGMEIEIPVTNLDALISWTIPFGTGIEILGPPEARERMLAHLAPYLGSK